MRLAVLPFLVLPWLLGAGQPAAFRHVQIDPAFRSEGVAVADFDRDGQLEVAAGNVLYRGPDWAMVPLGEAPREFDPAGYSDAFLCFAEDLDGDGWLDLIRVGFPGAPTDWLRNPGAAGGPWAVYRAVDVTGGESPPWTDVDGDGGNELVYFGPDGLSLAAPGDDPTAPWPQRVIASPGDPRPGHGLGVGDLDLDGRLDLVCPDGWWRQPADGSTPWPFVRAKLSEACAQMAVMDADGDGDQDILSTSAHQYGVWWTEQTADGWVMHEIDASVSQTHAMHLADLNGDGLLDIVTGKRFWAHKEGDPGVDEPAMMLWYELQRTADGPRWTKHELHDDSGVGLHFVLCDLDGDGRTDIICSSKKGVNLFLTGGGA